MKRIISALLFFLIFAVTSVASAFYSWQSPLPAVRRGVRSFSIILSAALLIATAYLVYWGFIGVRTWGLTSHCFAASQTL
ncbi:MAG TPA: hypothetical protein VJP02_03815 [Candidatus Sulfotelmatobacter sp.]|nr:hypothetical protein [Candidatus Sulfotelmatobacter sp.]